MVTLEGKDTYRVMIGARIAAAREEKGWTQDDLCDITGLSRSLLAKVETGVQAVRIGELSRLASALSKPPGYFLSLTPSELVDARDNEVYVALLRALAQLRSAKPDDRTEKDRHYAVVRTLIQQALGHFGFWVMGQKELVDNETIYKEQLHDGEAEEADRPSKDD